MAATLTKAMLEDLHKGSATVSLIPYTAGGVNFASMTFKDSDQIYTLAGSLTLSPEDAETNPIKIDQLDETIDFDMNEGNWLVNGNIPSISEAVLSYFFVRFIQSVLISAVNAITVQCAVSGIFFLPSMIIGII